MTGLEYPRQPHPRLPSPDHPRRELGRGDAGRPPAPQDVPVRIRTVGHHAGDVELDAQRAGWVGGAVAGGGDRGAGHLAATLESHPMLKRIAATTLVLLACSAGASAREGFGFTKKAAEMNYTAPPA